MNKRKCDQSPDPTFHLAKPKLLLDPYSITSPSKRVRPSEMEALEKPIHDFFEWFNSMQTGGFPSSISKERGPTERAILPTLTSLSHSPPRAKKMSILTRRALGGRLHSTGKWVFIPESTHHSVFGTPVGPFPGNEAWTFERQMTMEANDTRACHITLEAVKARKELEMAEFAQSFQWLPEPFRRITPFRFLDLPGEIRNAVYELAIPYVAKEDQRWCTLPLLQVCQLIRNECLGMYASSRSFSIPINSFTSWNNMLPLNFRRALKSINIRLPDNASYNHYFEISKLFCWKCQLAPECNITFYYQDTSQNTSQDTSLPLRHFQSRVREPEVDVNAFNALIRQLNKRALAELLASKTIREIYVDVRAKISRVTAKSELWCMYEDLKTAFGVQEDFILLVNDLQWTGTPLAKALGPRITRIDKNKATKHEDTQQITWEERIPSPTSSISWPNLAEKAMISKMGERGQKTWIMDSLQCRDRYVDDSDDED